MSLDQTAEYKKVKKWVEGTKQYKKITADIKDLKKGTKDVYETSESFISSTFKNAKEFKQKYQTMAKSQFDELLELKFISDIKTKNSTQKYIKETFVEALLQLEPKIQEIVSEVTQKTLGCADDQAFVGNQTFYIKVSSVDLFGILKLDPDSLEGKITYETKPIQYSVKPFTMNKELYKRIQNPVQTFSDPTVAGLPYKGKSGQDLFDISYVTSYTDSGGNLVVGDFYKIDVLNRVDNNVKEFIKDYFSTIKVFDYKAFFKNLINIILGAYTLEEKKSKNKLELDFKFLIILKRLLGICNDVNSTEIDVSGISKVSDIEEIDDSYFEFSDIDLAYIDQIISDIQLNQYEFVDCNVSKINLDYISISQAIDSLNFVDGENNSNVIEDAINLTNTIDTETKKVYDLNFLKEFPRALITTLLSPKVLLPLMVMGKSLNKSFVDEVNTSLDFAVKLKRYVAEITGKVMVEFIRILHLSIKQDLENLVKELNSDINEELEKKKYERILIWAAIIYKTANLFLDYRRCRNVIDDLLAIIGLISKLYLSKAKPIPFALLVTSRLLSGFSSNRAFLRAIEKFNELGIPTGPMPDGSPNLYMASLKVLIEAIDEEENENGVVQIAVEPLPVLPIGITTPRVVYGKKL